MVDDLCQEKTIIIIFKVPKKKGFLANIKSHPIFIIIGIPGVLGILYSEAKRV